MRGKNSCRILLLLILFMRIPVIELKSQEEDTKAFFIKSVFEVALENQMSYRWLYHLSENIGGRIAGSPQSFKAIDFTHTVLDTLQSDTVWNQACEVNYWYRGSKESVKIIGSEIKGKKILNVLCLGGSGATTKKGTVAEIIEVQSLEEIKERATEIKGKIVFCNRKWNNRNLRTFHSYGEAVDQRVFGPNEASKYGAVACIVRSMTGRMDDNPHTGVTIFNDGIAKIPALAVSTNDADYLSQLLKKSKIKLQIKTHCEDRGIVNSFSVIGEIKGSEKPDEIILVGGHLDSWDVGGGAHDDGAGCVQSIEVFYLLKKLNYKPRRTIRCVLFMNEENGLSGGKTYAKVSKDKKEFHYAAIESDAGGFTPKGLTYDVDTSTLTRYSKFFEGWNSLLTPYDIKISKGGSGADIGPLKEQKGILFGLSPDSQRYFDFHHTEVDRITAVHPRELALGSAAMTSLVYLLDQTP
ncbi:MAG: M28 family peptidase [Saprospiraceae bacterium]|nr:M28 family peptidase [Saprospiraceae bacterium]